jgi:hypothetical protein
MMRVVHDDDELPLRDPTAVVVAAYGMAALCLVLPLAVIGALFAGVVLLRRGRRAHGAAVIVVGVALAIVGALALT